MTIGVRFRLSLWTITGAIIAFGWALCFASADKEIPIGPIVFTVAGVTQPAAAVVSYFQLPFGVTEAVAWNAGAYAVVGLIVEMIRRHHRPLRISN
jgi:hypothetical protein